MGPRVALLALAPARLGIELPNIEDGFVKDVSISIEDFVSSLSWRQGKEITEETVDLLERLRQPRDDKEPAMSDQEWFELLIEMAPLSDCPINASYLKKELAQLPIGHRDASWSLFLVGKIQADDDDDVRGDVPPVNRKRSIELLWQEIRGLGQETESALEVLLEADRQQQSRRFSRFLAQLEKDEETDDVESTDTQADFHEAETAVLSMIPPSTAEKYRKIEPFNHYASSAFPTFSRQKGQYWVVARTFELGWDRGLHEDIERNQMRYSHGRHDHEVERIGKKYQHIAYSELIGYLADHHWYLEHSEEPSILDKIERFERADIDPTYLAGAHSQAMEGYDPGGISVPVLEFVPKNVRSNMDWTRTLCDIPEPTPFLIQTGKDGHDWCLASFFCRNKDYMKGFETRDLFRSAQYGVEVILVDKTQLECIDNLTTEKINQHHHEVFGNGWSSPPLYGQRSFNHQAGKPEFRLDFEAADFKFGRIFEDYSPKYSDYDRSGVSDEQTFATPHPALLCDLKLRPKSAWSRVFVTVDGEPAFADQPEFMAGITIIRHDLLTKFAEKNGFQVVWRVWVEKDGGRGSKHPSARRETFARHDYIGFFYQSPTGWKGGLIPFRA